MQRVCSRPLTQLLPHRSTTHASRLAISVFWVECHIEKPALFVMPQWWFPYLNRTGKNKLLHDTKKEHWLTSVRAACPKISYCPLPCMQNGKSVEFDLRLAQGDCHDMICHSRLQSLDWRVKISMQTEFGIPTNSCKTNWVWRIELWNQWIIIELKWRKGFLIMTCTEY